MSIAELTTKIENLSAEELSESIRKSDMGATKSARVVSKSMREKYLKVFLKDGGVYFNGGRMI